MDHKTIKHAKKEPNCNFASKQRYDSFKQETRNYIVERYQSHLREATRCQKTGCLVANHVRGDGYAQCKLRRGKPDGLEEHLAVNPRTYTLASFANEKFPEAGEDFSHICGNGASGCIEPSHCVIESRRKNLQRKSCHILATCPRCDLLFPAVPCTCQPPCSVRGPPAV